jgi:hypothetical protein
VYFSPVFRLRSTNKGLPCGRSTAHKEMVGEITMTIDKDINDTPSAK